MAYGESPQLDKFITDEQAGIKSLLGSQKAEQNALYGKYEAVTKAQEPLTVAYKRLGVEAGVPELSKTIGGFKGQIADLQGMISSLDDNITERTKGTFTSEAQRNRMVAYEGEDLNKQLGAVGTAMSPFTEQLSAAQSNIATMLGLTQADQQKELQPLIMQIDGLSDRFAREMTGYTQSKTMEFNTLLEKAKQGWQMEDAEWQRANDLADQESAWERTKQQLAIQYSNDVKLKGMTSGGTKADATPTKSEALNDLHDKIGEGIMQNANFDPNSPEGANTFRALYAKYQQYGVSMDEVKKMAADIWSGR